MARLGKLRPGPVGLAIAAWDVWRRLSSRQRQQVMALARKHGPKVARYAARRSSRR